jgi:polyhydroxybutyrate depolymerase
MLRLAILGALALPGCAGSSEGAPVDSGRASLNDASVEEDGAPTSTPPSTSPDGGAGDASPGDTSASDPPDSASASATDNGSNEGGSCAPAMTGMRGLTMQMVMVGGLARTYLMYLPPSLDPGTPAPLVFVFHGSTMTGQQMHDITQYADLADREGFAVVFPDGQGAPIYLAPWNVENPGQTVCGSGQLINATGDDFGFMDAMKATVASYQCTDSQHIFATGFSMGGYLSHHIGCYRDDVRAVAPHSGGTIASLSACPVARRPVIIFHGTQDGTIAPGCDDPNSAPQTGFPASATLWAQHNGCAATYTTVPESGDGGGAGQCYVYDGCPADGQVELCTFTGMAHCWAGGSTAGQGALSACPTYPSATELEWAFFKKYAW